MKCNRFRKLLIPYSEGSLPEERATPLQRHLSECDACASELQAITCTADVLRKADLPVFEPAADLRSRVLAEIAGKPMRRPWWQPAGLQAYSAAVAGLLLIAVAGAGMWQMMARNVDTPAPSTAVEHRVGKSVERPMEAAPAQKTPAETPSQAQPTDKKSVPAAKSPRTAASERWFFDATIAGESGSARLYMPSAAPSRPAADYRYSSSDDALSRLGSPAASVPKAVADADSIGLRYGTTAERSNAPAPEASQYMGRSVNQSDLGGNQGKRFGTMELQSQGALTLSERDLPKSSVETDAKGEYLCGDVRSLRPDMLAGAGNRMVDTGNSYSIAGGLVQSDISGLETKLRDFPSSVNVITDLMVRYRQAGRPRDEYNMAQRLTKLDPDNAGYWLSRAQAADRVPMRKTAEVCYERAIKLGLKGAQLEQARTRAKALESSSK